MHNLNARSALSLALLLLLSLVFVLHSFQFPNASLSKTHLHLQTHLQVAQSTCQGTLYPKLCVSTLYSLPNLPSKSVPQIISSVITHAVSEVKSSSHNYNGLRDNLRNLDPLEQRALDDCLRLFDDTIYELDATVADLSVVDNLIESI
ncbi:hypothetical protein QN277_025795 [Acacia crassicarpa]|uniref:Pectinesterase inhibitor domain-containing protein n=1 Tax=Acacia crassicarpa TaxID=499986 RepID=A0AAE1JAM3_9FABA|nr:hypothetical protein QN277_025795 [Acacia crassicarpa]